MATTPVSRARTKSARRRPASARPPRSSRPAPSSVRAATSTAAGTSTTPCSTRMATSTCSAVSRRIVRWSPSSTAPTTSRSNTQIGAFVYAGSGTPMTTYVNTVNQTEIFVEGRGDMGRTPMLQQDRPARLARAADGGQQAAAVRAERAEPLQPEDGAAHLQLPEPRRGHATRVVGDQPGTTPTCSRATTTTP